MSPQAILMGFDAWGRSLESEMPSFSDQFLVTSFSGQVFSFPVARFSVTTSIDRVIRHQGAARAGSRAGSNVMGTHGPDGEGSYCEASFGRTA
jgi:hypothetical protein